MLFDSSKPFRPRPDGTPSGAGEGSCFHATTQRRNEARGTTTLQNLSYTWDAKTNLKSRGDSLAGTSEIFAYDKLNRLISSTDGASSISNYTYTPDNNGNLLSKPFLSGVSYGGSRPHAITAATVRGLARSYTYDAAGRVTSDGERSYQWTSFGQLLQVSQISTPLLKTFDPTQRYVIAGTPPSGIPGIPTAQQYQASIGTATFDFDASGSCWKQDLLRTYVGGGTARLTTLYLGSYERETLTTQATGGATPVLQKTLHRHQLGTAIYTIEEKPSLAPVVKLSALLTDHLGSTDVILAATWNGTQWSGFQAERQSFDPWGERRNPDTWATQRTQSTDPRVTSGADYHRGFTGHEMLDDFGLIHMNGRIYDPEIGRFLSCDPYVQVPEFSQNFNRYSYVLNNPLTFTDPTGHQINGTWAAIIVIVVIIVVTIVTWGSCTAAAGAWGGAILGSTATAAVTASVGAWAVAAIGGAFLGGIAGGLSAKLAGGDFGDVLRGGTIGGLQGGVTAGFLHGLEPAAGAGGFNAQTAIHVAGHGIVGGAANAAMGGKFQDGFISGAVSAAAADLGAFDSIKGGNLAVAGRTAMAGIVGGTASALGGGKFANGAFTAAFQHFLNAESPALKKAFFIGHDMRAGTSGKEAYDAMIDSARRAGYHVHPDAFWSAADTAWKSREYDEIVYFNHGTDQAGGQLARDVQGQGQSYQIMIDDLNKMFDVNSGHASKLTIVSCYYDKVAARFVASYKANGVELKTLPIPQVPYRQVFVVEGKSIDARPGFIWNRDAVSGLTGYFQSQKR